MVEFNSINMTKQSLSNLISNKNTKVSKFRQNNVSVERMWEDNSPLSLCNITRLVFIQVFCASLNGNTYGT